MLSLFIFHLRYDHIWASASLEPEHEVPVAFLFWGGGGLERSEITATRIFLGSETIWFLTIFFFYLHHPTDSGLRCAPALCFPPLSRIITLRANKREQAGAALDLVKALQTLRGFCFE